MMSKSEKTKKKSTRARRGGRRGRIGRLQASVEEELLRLAEGESGAESRWNRPRKQKVTLYVDREVLDWMKSKGPGYQTRISRILRRVMEEGKQREG